MSETIATIAIDDGRQGAGIVCAANESRFEAAHLSEPLTAFTVGWRDPEDLRALLDFIAPPVRVGRRFEFRRADNAEAFLSESDDTRAIGSAFKRVEYSGESVNAKTYNKGLTIRVDHDEEVGDDWQERYVQLLVQRLLRSELRRAVSALDSQDVSESKTWTWNGSTNPTPNPDGDLRSALAAASNATGLRPNRVIYGESAWDLRSNAYYMQESAGAFHAASLTPEELARRIFVDGVRVVSARYTNGSARSEILGGNVYAFHAQDGATKDEPSNIKRFVTPAGGSDFRVYLETSSKYTDITVEHYSAIVITSTAGIRRIAVS
ncbi:MAG TPA: hypothetical protein PKI32_04220 [Opitutales bacterium]|nr:hypothetical protein [Opitutales bacterium]